MWQRRRHSESCTEQALHSNVCRVASALTCAQPLAMRKPVMTSSKQSSAPSSFVISRRPCSTHVRVQA